MNKDDPIIHKTPGGGEASNCEEYNLHKTRWCSSQIGPIGQGSSQTQSKHYGPLDAPFTPDQYPLHPRTDSVFAHWWFARTF